MITVWLSTASPHISIISINLRAMFDFDHFADKIMIIMVLFRQFAWRSIENWNFCRMREKKKTQNN